VKTMVVIPAFNAEDTLRSVIERIPPDVFASLHGLVVVNAGSRDQTADLSDSLADETPGIRAFHLPENRGYGGAMKQGLALARTDGADVVVCLHADGQYAPELLPQLLAERARRNLDILQGSRIASGTALSGGMPVYKYLAGRLLTFLENRVFGLGMSDYHSGYMIYSRRALEKIPFDRLSDSFDFDLEMIASARARGLAIGEWPVPTRYAGEVSYLSPVRYGFQVLGVMLGYLNGKYDQAVHDE
jgi:glycosyltransferase involved in cell wall biosynthesis